jgi:hypothetical protein
MSKNIDQVFIANPASSMQANDLLYLGRSPYGATNDMAILYSNFLTGIAGNVWNSITAATATMTPDQGYIANRATLVTLTLPTTAAVGTELEISGLGAGGWLIAQNALQSINDGNSTTTIGTGGSLASTQRYNAIRLLCVVANTTWNVLSGQGNFTIV